MKSPIGTLYIGEKNGYITDITLKKIDGVRKKTKAIEQVIKEITEYFKGERIEFSFKMNEKASPFQKKVFGYLKTIPYGKTRTYSDVAMAIGDKRYARACGRAIGKNPIMIAIPCHRVIRKDNTLGGFSGGVENKKILLNLERDKC